MSPEVAAVREWQAQAACDRARQRVEHAIRTLRRYPDGDSRRIGAERELSHALSALHGAERLVLAAADALL